MFTVYVIQDESGLRYIGQTDDLVVRLKQHNLGISKWTKRGRGWRVIYSEQFDSRR